MIARVPIIIIIIIIIDSKAQKVLTAIDTALCLELLLYSRALPVRIHVPTTSTTLAYDIRNEYIP